MSDLEEISRELEFTQSTLESHFSDIQSRFKLHLQSLISQQESLNSLRESLDSKAKALSSIEEALVSKEEALNSKEEALDYFEATLDSNQEALDSHLKELLEKERALESKEKSLLDRESAVVEKEQALEQQEKALICKEELLVSRENFIGPKEVAVRAKEEMLVLRENYVSTKEVALRAKEESLSSRESLLSTKEVALRGTEELLVSRENAVSTKEVSLRGTEESLLSRESLLSTKEVSLRGMEEFLVSRENAASTKEVALRAKEEAIVLKEKEVALREKSVQLETQVGNSSFKVKAEPIDTLDAMGNDVNLRFSVCMDGRGLQMFLNERVDEHVRIRNEVYAALQMSTDPAKLVLDAMEGFYIKKEDRLVDQGVRFEISVVRKSCVLLLEQLIRCSPRVKLIVREHAKKIAKEWEEKMGESNLEVLGFLLILAAYGLTSEFDREKAIRLFRILPKDLQISGLDHALGIPNEVAFSRSTTENVRPNSTSPSYSGMLDSGNTPEKNSVDSVGWPELKSFCAAMDGGGLRTFLSYHVGKHEAMQTEVFYALHCAPDPAKLVLDAIQDLPSNLSEQELFSHRTSCVLLSEQLMRLSPHIESSVKEEAIKIAVNIKSVLLGEEQSSLESLMFLQLVATFGLASSFDVDELVLLLEDIDKVKRTSDLCQALGFVDNIQKLKSFCIEMDGHGLRTFLSHHVFKLEKMRSEVLYALQCAPDPAKLVLDVIRHLPSNLSKRKMGLHGASCILLLEQLMTLSPQIEFSVKEEAQKCAVSHKKNLSREQTNPFESLLFLQLVATFGLASSFDVEELFHLLRNIDEKKRISDLVRALGLVDNIQGIVRSIIKKGQHLEAIAYIYEFDLTDKFHAEHLLEAYVNASKIHANKIVKEGNNSLQSQSKAAKKEIEAMRAAIKCITDHKLESQYPIENLHNRIAVLEKHCDLIAELEKQTVRVEARTEPASSSPAIESVQCSKKRCGMTDATVGPSTVSVGTDSTIVPEPLPKKQKGCGNVFPPPCPPSDVQSHMQNGIENHQTAVSTVAAPTASFGTASVTPMLQPFQHLANHHASYPCTSGPQNLGAPHSRDWVGPYGAGPSFVSPHLNSLATQYGAGIGANGILGLYNSLLGMHAGSVNPSSSLTYFPSSHTL